jgi:hypothetical protein
MPFIHDLVILVKKTLTMAGLRINIMELRQIIRLKKEGNSNRKDAEGNIKEKPCLYIPLIHSENSLWRLLVLS